jgi:outer membrane protein insertion porin family
MRPTHGLETSGLRCNDRAGHRGQAMRFTAAAFLLAGIVTIECGGAQAQDSTSPRSDPVKVRTLTLTSSDLVEGDRQRIIQAFQGGEYPPEELAERVRQALRDVGFNEVKVDDPQLSGINDSTQPRSADVSIRVTTGAQYRLAEIRFEGVSDFTKDQLVFTSELLRKQFPIEPGALFNTTAISRGMDRMRDLYLGKGYADFVAIPKPAIDEAKRTITLTIEIDKGRPYYFGRLILDGVEPHAGDAKLLLDAWTGMRSRPYDPHVLSDWLAAHAPYWPDAAESMQHTATTSNPETQLVDVQLKLP